MKQQKQNPLIVLIFLLSVMAAVVTVIRDDMNPDSAINIATRENQVTRAIPANNNVPVLSPQRIIHILEGDHTGGGHRYGMGRPCKSEFPQNWSDDDILLTVQTMAANDNARWNRGDNGFFATTQTASDGTKIRVVVDQDHSKIITAYPVNTRRNPCPGQ